MRKGIVPAVLKESLVAIEEAVSAVRDLVPYVQIDIVDGIHAPTVTWPFPDGVSPSVLSRLHNLRTAFELDLMIHRPEEHLDTLFSSGADRYIIHLSSTGDLERCVDRITGVGSEAAVALCIGDSADAISAVSDRISAVQCMGIAEVGRQGEPFDPRAVPLIRAVRERYPSLPISVDGGVSVPYIPELRDAGVSQFVVGSALFSGDVESNFAALSSA